jgi:hypothetical protein
MKVVSPKHWSPLPCNNISGTSCCYMLCRFQGHKAVGKFISMINSSITIGNRTCDLPACCAMPQQNARYLVMSRERMKVTCTFCVQIKLIPSDFLTVHRNVTTSRKSIYRDSVLKWPATTSSPVSSNLPYTHILLSPWILNTPPRINILINYTWIRIPSITTIFYWD